MENVKVKCPQCGKGYLISHAALGKKARCKSCSMLFTTQVEPEPPSKLEQLAEVIATPGLPNPTTGQEIVYATPPTQEKKGFFAKMSEIADQASRQVTVKYMQGPWGINANSPVTIVLGDDALLVRSGIFSKTEICIPYESITGITIDTAERMTLTRVALVGIFAFGMKKKDKFLEMDFTDDTGTAVTAIFGGGSVQTLQGRILEKKHDRLLRIKTMPTATVAENTSTAVQATDISASIENLARLRDKGMLNEEEFQAKKKELLARL